MIDDDVLLADLGRGVSAFTKRDLERDARVNHVLRNDRITGLDREGLAQLGCRFPGGRIQSGKLDAFKPVLRAGCGRQRYRQRVSGCLDARLDEGVIISLASKQFRKQFGVQQCAVFGPTAIVDGIARAQVVQPVRDAGMFSTRHQ